MVNVQYSDIIIATVAALLFSTIYYAIFGRQVRAARTAYTGEEEDGAAMSPGKFAVEVVRTFVVGLFIAYAVALLNFLYIQQAVLLALWLWVAFPVVLLVGWVLYDHAPAKLAVIHAGDWLAKLLVFTCILTLWR